MDNKNLSREFANTGLSRADLPESVFGPMNIPDGVSESARELFERAFYIAQGIRVETWQNDLIFLDQQVKENPKDPTLRVLLGATLQGAGELGGAGEQYKIAADMAGDSLDRAYLLEKTAECAAQAGNNQDMVQNYAGSMLTYLGK